MQSKTLNLALSVALVCMLTPVPALAQEGEGAAPANSWLDAALDIVQGDKNQLPAEQDQAAGVKANSWRFTDGYANDALGDAAADLGFGTMGAWPDLGPGDLDISSTWTKADGPAKYTVRKTPNGASTQVTVPGSLAVGIDVSAHNNQPGGKPAAAIDWQKVKSEGISFAIIRCGYGSNYTSQDDKWFASNIKGALEAGLQVGVYLYSYAPKATGTAPSATSEADHVLRLLKANNIQPSDLALPVYLDLEDDTQQGLKKGTLGAIATEFCGKIQAAGYKAGIYANQYWFNSVLKNDSPVFDPATMQKNGWSRWVARYAANATASGVEATDLWQFTCIGKVEGIPKTYCDVNFSYLDFAGTAAGGSATSPTAPSAPTTTPAAKPTTSTVAKPAPVAIAKITYKLNGGKNNAANSKSFTGTLKLKSPKRSGYTFGGWFTDKKCKKRVTTLNATQASKGKFTLYAKWYKNYKVTYKLNGGVNHKSNPKKYGGSLTLKNPTRQGYTFAGWYTNKKLTKKVTKLTVTKNRTVYAKWVKAKKGTYRITSDDGLFIRQKASTSAPIIGGLGYNQQVKVVKVSKGWGKLAEGGWINLSYAKRV